MATYLPLKTDTGVGQQAEGTFESLQGFEKTPEKYDGKDIDKSADPDPGDEIREKGTKPDKNGRPSLGTQKMKRLNREMLGITTTRSIKKVGADLRKTVETS